MESTPKMAPMISRLLKLPNNQSFFLFGARGTGKSTLIEHQFDHQDSLWLDLLDPEAVCFSNDRFEKMIGNIRVIPWQEGLKRYFKDTSFF